MTPVAINERLAHLLTVQGGLLDAYLEQNMGARYAYCILVWEQVAPSRVRAVTNVQDHRYIAPLVREVADFATPPEGAEPIVLDHGPMFVDTGP